MVDDELWGSDNDQELDQEWQARQTQFHTLGYRDGVEAGKNASVQEGFNVGYAESTVAGFNLGLARGLTAALAALPGAARESLVSGGEARARLETLEASIRRYSSADAQRAFYLTEVSGEDTSMAGVDRVPQTSSVGVWAAQGVSGRRELEEMARSVRSELEAASVNISDVLVAV